MVTADYDVRKPKLHLWIEMTRRSDIMGNPWAYHCFYDEALNKLLKATLRNVSQSNFEMMGMSKLQEQLRSEAAVKRAKV